MKYKIKKKRQFGKMITMDIRMKRYVCILFFLLLAGFVFSNDSRIVLGSSVEIIDNENTNIIMQEEEIVITLHKDYYEINVHFNFYNEGPAEEVLLGFPVESFYQPVSDNYELAQINDFKSYINGVLLSEYTVREESTEERFYTTTTKWFLRKVVFPANSVTYTRVVYTAPYNHSGFFKSAGYIYGTGRSWKGSIGKMTVIINHGDDIIITGVHFRNNHPVNFAWEGNGKYKYMVENFKPELDSRISIGIEPFEIYGKYGNEFGDWANGWVWNEYLLYKNFADIKLYTKNQIRLFINFFYAFHGYDFKNELYKNYFRNLNSFMDFDSTKYAVNPDFSENSFNEIERKNIDYLLNLEKMIP